MSESSPLEAVCALLDWIADLSLREVDGQMWNRLQAPASKEELLRQEPALQAAFARPATQELETLQEAYTSAFILPKGPGLRLTGLTQGDNEQLGPKLEHELRSLLALLGKAPHPDRFGKLPSDHVGIALNALSCLGKMSERPKVIGLGQAQFVLALGRWFDALARSERVHPLYRAAGKVGQEILPEYLSAIDCHNSAASAGHALPVLQ